ncbi:MEDS domain-containing protein [Micromonospora inyonensis]|uniref:MEDS domain-containing protein n=1 Tax=Micromonospora inyonensis TaxID=47866 RepID=UPI001FE04458|nr:MEDS domain-containing protein [Micromonospora inyonensis]
MNGRSRQAAYQHVCWRYDDRAALHAQARAFLLEGLALGERIWYVTSEPDPVADQLREEPLIRDAIRRGAARIVPLGSAYAHDHIVDPDDQVRAYATATEDALAAGHTGLRVAADATALVRTPAQRDAFARYEHLIDRYMRVRPMSAMCAYDRRLLGDEAVRELACLHPGNNADDVLFRLYAETPGDGHAALVGELDASNHDLFRAALERADPRPAAGRLVVEATDLRFIDHRNLIHLRDHARARGAVAVLRTSRSAAARVAELLDLPELDVEVTR